VAGFTVVISNIDYILYWWSGFCPGVVISSCNDSERANICSTWHNL